MTTSPALEVSMSDKDYSQIATDIFQGYADGNLESNPFWESIKMDFEDWTKEHWDAINGKTWTAIKAICVPRGVWIDDYKGHGSRSEILMKLVSAAKFDTKLKDWDMDRINDVQNTYGKVSRGIALRLQHLRGEEPEEIQQFQETGFQTPPHQAAVEPLSNLSPYLYRRHQSQKQDPPLFSQQTPPPQHPSQSSSQKQPFVSQDVRNQQYQPTHGVDHGNENQHRRNNYQPASLIPTIRQYSKELTQLDKLYKNEDKFGGTGDNFAFKLSIFYDKCQLVGLPSDAYLEGASVMLTGQAQTHFYANRESIVSFDDFCRKIRLFFEGPEWERLNLIKWQTVSLADTIAANPTLSATKCLCKMCTEIDKIQHSVNSA